MNFRENDGSIKAIVIVVIIVLVFVIGIVATIISSKTMPVESIQEETYEYFVLNSLDGTVGVVNKNGENIIESKYTYIYIPNHAKDVFFCFEDDETYVILDSNSNEIFEEYSSVTPIYLADSSNEMEKEVLCYEEDGKYGLINYDGKKITNAIYDQVSSLQSKPGCILVKQDGLYGVLDSSGNVIINVEYYSIKGDEYSSSTDGYLKTGYIVSEKTDSGIMYGYIDYNGKVLIKPQYESISRAIEYEDDDIYLIYMDGGKKGVIKNKKTIIKAKYQAIIYNSSSDVFVVNKNGKYGFFDINGDEILPAQYTAYSIAGNYISVTKDDNMMLYDLHGNLINTNTYKSILETGNPSYFIAEDENGYYSIISKDEQIANNYTSIVYAFDNFYIYTTEDSLSGVLGLYSGIEVEAQYDYIIVLDDIKALIAKSGNTVDVYSEKIEKVLSLENGIVQKIDNDYVSIYSDTEIYYINNVGELVSNTEVYSDAKLYSYKAEDGKWGFVNSNGDIIVDCKYDIVTELNKYGYAGICQDGKWGVIDEEGNVVVVPTYELETYYFPTFLGKYQLETSEVYYCIELEEN